MELILVSSSKLKVMLTPGDMESYALTCDTIDYDNTETRRAFWDILDTAKHKTGFDAAGARIYIQVYPAKGGGCELFVTKLGAARGGCGPTDLQSSDSAYDTANLCGGDIDGGAAFSEADLRDRGESGKSGEGDGTSKPDVTCRVGKTSHRRASASCRGTHSGADGARLQTSAYPDRRGGEVCSREMFVFESMELLLGACRHLKNGGYAGESTADTDGRRYYLTLMPSGDFFASSDAGEGERESGKEAVGFTSSVFGIVKGVPPHREKRGVSLYPALGEFGIKVSAYVDADVARAYLAEHGSVICRGGAVETLGDLA